VRAPSLLAEAFASIGEALEAHRMARMALARDANNRKARAVFESTRAAYEQWSGSEG
jgi:hypothetical protein